MHCTTVHILFFNLVPAIIGITTPPLNPGLPALGSINTGRPKTPSVATSVVGSGPPRRYVTIKSKLPNVHYPPRPHPGGIADLDIIMDNCDFSTQKVGSQFRFSTVIDISI